jgi:hypothetical protein
MIEITDKEVEKYEPKVNCCIKIKKIVLAKNDNKNSCTPHCLKYQSPTQAIKLDATNMP